MGGFGSGQTVGCSTKNTIDRHRTLDIRRLKRQGILAPGTSHLITWSCSGVITSSINISAETDRLLLSYSNKNRDGIWTQENYHVALVKTPCHTGGERSWFLCPRVRCGQRVAILYSGEIYACRKCNQLAYQSQRETVPDRAARKADKIRARLGWKAGILNKPSPYKPKGMHWRTFERLKSEYKPLEQLVLKSLIEDLHLFED